ncbi:MAG: cation transporter [Ruminococcaceae bacterium]|nr:cation transporter [Oscillospiraceae bacterium]
MTEILSKIFVKDYKNISDGKVRKSYGTLSSFVGISVNAILAFIKLFLGIITASVAIIADALNNLSDAGSSIITLVSFRMSAKPADRDHPFGHARIEYIASMIISFLILLVGFETFIKSVSVLIGMSDASVSNFSTVSIIILASSILLKLWLSFFYRKIGNKINSSVIKASSIDSLTDCISTVAVLISAIIIKITNLQIIDTVVGLGVSVMIIIAGIKILNETKNSILGEAPINEQVEAINKIIAEYPEIIGTHDLMIHNYGPNHFIASFHAEVDGEKDIFILHDMIDIVEKRIQSELNILCTIHMDPIVTDDGTVNELKSFVLETIREDVSSDISIHDFRVVVGNTHTNMIFDIILPFESKDSPDLVIEKICNAVNNRRKDCFCVITVDRG